MSLSRNFDSNLYSLHAIKLSFICEEYAKTALNTVSCNKALQNIGGKTDRATVGTLCKYRSCRPIVNA